MVVIIRVLLGVKKLKKIIVKKTIGGVRVKYVSS